MLMTYLHTKFYMLSSIDPLIVFDIKKITLSPICCLTVQKPFTLRNAEYFSKVCNNKAFPVY